MYETHTHTRQNWIFEEIHQELSPLTCKIDGKQINLRSIRIIEVLRKVYRDQNRHQIVWRPNIEGIVEVNFRLRQPCKIDTPTSNCDNRDGSWVSHCPSRENKTGCRYAELIRLCITTNWQCLRWAVSVSRALPPCFIKRREERKIKNGEVLHLFRCYTHTVSTHIYISKLWGVHYP